MSNGDNIKKDGPTMLGLGIQVFPGVSIDQTCIVGHGSVLGYPGSFVNEVAKTPATVVSPNCHIGCYCVIEAGTRLEERVCVDHYVRVGPSARIGAGTRLLYGTRIHEDVQIGQNCRISGNCPDRTIIGDMVTHFGRMHHSYNMPFSDWDETVEDSPRIGNRSVIGANAILVGGISVGDNCYIAAGEIVRRDVPSRSIVYHGKIIPGSQWRGRLSQYGFFDEGSKL